MYAIKPEREHSFLLFPKETKKVLVFLDAERFNELRERDAMGFGCLADSLAAGDGAADTAHAELEEGFGCLGLGLEEIIDGAVCGNFSHGILRLTPCDINLTIAAKETNPTLSLHMLTLYSPDKAGFVTGDV
jgi:hypothetical protein